MSGPAAPLAARLRAGAYAPLALLPLAAALANRSSPLLLLLAALPAIAGLALERGPGGALRAALAPLRTPPGLAALAFGALALASLLWAHRPGASAAVLGEALVSVAAGLALVAGLSARPPRWAVPLAAVGIALAAGVVLGDLALGLPLRRLLSARAEPYVYQRPIIACLILAWPVAALRWAAGPRRDAVALIALALVLAASGASGAAALAAPLALAALALAARRPRIALGAAALALVAAFALAPFKGEVLRAALPDALVGRLSGAHAGERVALWRDFGAVIARRPLLGVGFGASAAVAADPVAAELPPERRAMVAVGHPHDAAMQAWVELGLAGAALALAGLLLLLRGLARLPAALLAPRLAALAAAAGIASVGPGAWQGWWIAVLAAAAAWFSREAGWREGVAEARAASAAARASRPPG